MNRYTPFSTRLSGSAKETELRLRNIFRWKKKRPPMIALVLILAVILGCGGLVVCRKQPARTDPIHTEQQLQVILRARAAWQAAEETDWWGFVVTDLDQNGRLEIISSETHGSGHPASTRIWEVNEELDGLTECSIDGDCGSVMRPDTTVSAYRDPKSGHIWILSKDDVWNGDHHRHESMRGISFMQGVVVGELLGLRDSIFDESGAERMLYQNADGTAITKEEYIRLPQERFSGLTPISIQLSWVEATHPDDGDDGRLYDSLKRSAEGFLLSERTSREPEGDDPLLQNLYGTYRAGSVIAGQPPIDGEHLNGYYYVFRPDYSYTFWTESTAPPGVPLEMGQSDYTMEPFDPADLSALGCPALPQAVIDRAKTIRLNPTETLYLIDQELWLSSNAGIAHGGVGRLIRLEPISDDAFEEIFHVSPADFEEAEALYGTEVPPSPEASLHPALENWLDEQVDGPVYLPTGWTPVCSDQTVILCAAPETDGSYQLDFYRGGDGSDPVDRVYALGDVTVNAADYLGSLSRGKTRKPTISIAPTTPFKPINIDENLMILSARHGTLCRWTLKEWSFTYVGPSQQNREENTAQLLRLASRWEAVDMEGITDGRVEIVSGNRDTVYYSWEKDGYYWELVLPDLNIAAAITVLNHFEKWK